MKEKELHLACVRYLQALKGMVKLAFHHSPNEARTTLQHNIHRKAMGMQPGWPDLEIFLRGRVIFVELKAHKTRQTSLQKAVERDLKALGYEYHLLRADSIQQGLDRLEEILNG